MAIAALQIPGNNINNAVDPSQWSQLANLGNVYRQAQEDAAKQTALSRLGQGPQADAQTLLTSGVPSLAQLGLNLQSQQSARDEQIREFNAQQNIRAAQERRAQSTFEEDSPEGRAAKLTAAGLNPKDPAYQGYLATGQNPPNPIQQAAEKRAQTTFTQEQAVATPSGRRQVAIDNGYDLKDPGVRAWILTGQNMPNTAALNRGGLQIQYGVKKNDQGEDVVVPGQVTEGGEWRQLAVPPGVQATAKPIVRNTGTMIETVNPYTGEVLSQKPIDVAGKAAQNVQGTAQGKAIVDLPKTEADAKLVTDTIDKALAPHPGKSWSVGTMFKDIPAIPGTATADYRAILDQLNSQTFLEAYNSLKGGGAISNYEDKRASAAKARLSTAQSPQAFDDALREYREIVQSGVERMRTLAGKQAPAVPAAPPAAARPPLGAIFGQ